MVPEDRGAPDLLGFGLKGSWISLEPSSDVDGVDLEAIDDAWALNPAMGGIPFAGRHAFSEPMSIRENSSGTVIGLVANHRLPGDVASFLLFLDPARGRAAHGVETLALYVSH